MHSGSRFPILAALAVTFLVAAAHAQEGAILNHVGRVRVQGRGYTGEGDFKFAIVSTDGSQTLWSNDGTSAEGSEPAGAITLDLNEGIYSVDLGDAEGGMAPIPAILFNNADQLWLRIWFSDRVHGFQRLLPDRRIHNQHLLRLVRARQDFSMFVDASSGNDRNDGLTTATAKKTIQAAIDVLPDRIESNVTINIRPGVYRESVMLTGIHPKPGKQLRIYGDLSWTPSDDQPQPTLPNVRITGSNTDLPYDRVRQYGLQIVECSGVVVRGVMIDGTSRNGANLQQTAASFIDCYFLNNAHGGILCENNSSADYRRCLAEGGQYGFRFCRSSTARVDDCAARQNDYGLNLSVNSIIEVDGTGNYSDNSNAGIHAAHNSAVLFVYQTYSGQIRNNDQYPIFLTYDSYVQNADQNTMTGNGNGNAMALRLGSHSYD